MSTSAAVTLLESTQARIRTSTINTSCHLVPTTRWCTRFFSRMKFWGRRSPQRPVLRSKWRWTCPWVPTSSTKNSNKIKPLSNWKKNSRRWRKPSKAGLSLGPDRTLMPTNQRLWMQARLQLSRCREWRRAWPQPGELRPNLRLRPLCSPLSILAPSQEPLVLMGPRSEY